jgi:hypothetical protein
MSRKQITALWGTTHGRCRSCSRPTWYFNEKPFVPQGVGATFERGRAVALFTVWQPEGWRTPAGLTLGDASARVTEIYGPLARRGCAGYDALVRPGRRVQTAFYIDGDALWGFGLTMPGTSPCL